MTIRDAVDFSSRGQATFRHPGIRVSLQRSPFERTALPSTSDEAEKTAPDWWHLRVVGQFEAGGPTTGCQMVIDTITAASPPLVSDRK
jgi:hypothetical protein